MSHEHEHTITFKVKRAGTSDSPDVGIQTSGPCADPDCRTEIKEEIAGIVLDWLKGIERENPPPTYIHDYERPLLEAARRYREAIKEDGR